MTMNNDYNDDIMIDVSHMSRMCVSLETKTMKHN